MVAKRRIKVRAGDRYGKLTVLKESQPEQWGKYKKRMVACRCDCGQETVVRLEYLRSGHTESCGCNRKTISAVARKTHGKSGTKLHGIWAGVLARCRNKNTRSYKYYGAKGVVVCSEWHRFEPFAKWALRNGYREGLSIDRIDPFGNYEPSNCRWIPRSEQRYTRRDMVEVS